MTEPEELQDGDLCALISGTHAGKSETVADIKSSKTGAITITVVQADGERFKTLASNASRVSAGGESKA
ncbi:hypothetical protein [Timonella senegalensis]|uniref:hypothetical protein n=1 Tax=Timonella senegalensis TaxID=1465825 RepID=UPI002FDD85E4